MKARTYILTALMLINIHLLCAKEVSSREVDGLETISLPLNLIRALAPETPKEATFEEVDFKETKPEAIIDIKALAPVLPAEAEFEDENNFVNR